MASSNRLYVSHGTQMDVLDADSGKVLGKVEPTPGVHGVAIVPELHRGFITNGGDATVSVFDTNTFKTIKKISVAKDPDFVFYDPNTKRVLVCHGDGEVITAIDPAKETVIGEVKLGGGAEAGRGGRERQRLRESGGIGPGGAIRSREPGGETEVSDHGMQDAHGAGDGCGEFTARSSVAAARCWQ